MRIDCIKPIAIKGENRLRTSYRDRQNGFCRVVLDTKESVFFRVEWSLRGVRLYSQASVGINDEQNSGAGVIADWGSLPEGRALAVSKGGTK